MIAGRQLQINWKVGLFTLLLLPLLFWLGFWQLDREAEKRALESLYMDRLGAVPVTIDDAREMDDLSFVAVATEGRYDNGHSFLLDNRIYESQPGFEVVTPFVTDQDKVLLVNRGWVPQGRYRSELPLPPEVTGLQYLTGNVYVPAGEPVTLAPETDFAGWPRVLQSVDVGLMYDELNVAPERQALAFTVRLQEAATGVLDRNWPAVNTSPQKHRAYAVQWFSMAMALIILFLASSFPRRRNNGSDPQSTD